MAKHIATVSLVVVRDGKRVHVGPGSKHKHFDFSKEEVEQINGIHPGALRKPVNETADDEAKGTAETAPEKTVEPTANKANKKSAKTKAAEKDSQSEEATKDIKSADGEGTSQDAEDGEDDDI